MEKPTNIVLYMRPRKVEAGMGMRGQNIAHVYLSFVCVRYLCMSLNMFIFDLRHLLA